MKKLLLLSLVLVGGSVFAQHKKDSIVYQYKPRYYLNQDSTKVKEFIKKTIEEQRKTKERQKQKNKTTYYWNTELCLSLRKKPPLGDGLVFDFDGYHFASSLIMSLAKCS